MKKASVLALKEEIFDEVDSELRAQRSVHNKVEALRDQPPSKRIAVGYSQIKKNDFRLEIRVQRRDRWAHHYAQRIVDRAPGEANFEIIPRIQIPTDKEVMAHPPKTPIIIDRANGRLQIGLSIGPKDNGIGTLGVFLSCSDGIYVLSCRHVMVPNKGAVISHGTIPGDPIYHPGHEPGYRLDATRQIANLSNYVPLSRKKENFMDCAIARLDTDWQCDVTRVPVGYGYPDEGSAITILQDPEHALFRNTYLCKIGRTTHYTRGVIRAIGIDRVPVFVPGEGNVLFSDVVEVRSLTTDAPFSEPGDSGSLVFTEDRHEAVGLVFAGGAPGRRL